MTRTEEGGREEVQFWREEAEFGFRWAGFEVQPCRDAC